MPLTFKLIGWRRQLETIWTGVDDLEEQIRRRRPVVMDAFEHGLDIVVGEAADCSHDKQSKLLNEVRFEQAIERSSL